MKIFHGADHARSHYEQTRMVLDLALAHADDVVCSVSSAENTPAIMYGAAGVGHFEQAFMYAMSGARHNDSWTLTVQGVLLAHLVRDRASLTLVLNTALISDAAIRFN